jgi:hypothetical protein
MKTSFENKKKGKVGFLLLAFYRRLRDGIMAVPTTMIATITAAVPGTCLASGSSVKAIGARH